MNDVNAVLDGVHGPVAYAVIALWTIALFWFPTGLVFPGEPFYVVAGVLAAGGQLSLPLTLIIVIVSSILSPTGAYFVGRRFDDWLRNRPEDSKFRRMLVKGEDAVRRRGALAAALSCWVPLLRVTVPTMIGASRYPFPRFLALSASGTTVWCSLFVLGGYYAGPFFTKFAVYVGIALLVALVGAGLVKLVRRVLRRPATVSADQS